MMDKVFSVWDSKVEVYHDPFIALNQGEALRTMEDLVNSRDQMGNPRTVFGKAPQDFTLFELGEYDRHSGTFRLYEAKKSILTLIELKHREQARSSNPPDVDLAGVRSVN